MSVVNLPKLYTEDEVAEYLDVTPMTIYRERKRGRLGYTLVAKKIRFTAEHIDAYLRSRECTAISSSEKKTASGTSGSTTRLPDNAASLALVREIVRKPTKSSPPTS